MLQHEITAPIPLLDERGNLTEPGFARKLLPVYDRSRIRARADRRKEWDYYLVMGEGFALALTVADNGYMGLDSISLLDFEEGWQVTRSPMRLLPMGRTGLPATSERGNTVSTGRGYSILFRNEGEGRRKLLAHMENFRDGQTLDAHVVLTGEPEESMVICTPFDKPGHFYYNQKINCMAASGTVKLGERTYPFLPGRDFGTLDWGRGVWTYHNTWYWSSLSTRVEGVPFGFNLGYGFGDTSHATENMLFYGGKAHKLGRVRFHIPRERGFERFTGADWAFTSDDGRLEAVMTPVMDRAACTSAGIIKSDQHQVFGRFRGSAVLDDGRAVYFDGPMGFAEKVENKW